MQFRAEVSSMKSKGLDHWPTKRLPQLSVVVIVGTHRPKNGKFITARTVITGLFYCLLLTSVFSHYLFPRLFLPKSSLSTKWKTLTTIWNESRCLREWL